MKTFISLSKDISDYDFALFNGKRVLNISAGARSLSLKPGDTFGYRSARNSVYIVTPVRGLDYEYKLTEDDFDRRIAPKADEVTPAKAKKAFAQAAKEPKPTAPRTGRTGKIEPVVKKVTPLVKKKEEAVKQEEKSQDQEEHEIVKVFGNPTRFARIRSTGDAIAYMIEVWQKVNKLRCDSQLVQPTFILTKDMGASTRRLGMWHALRRTIGASPRLFKAKEHVALTTIVHEIAHQAVSEIDKVRETLHKGHGPVWNKWMYKFGLNPARYSQFDKLEYFNDTEKKQILQQHEQAKQNLEQADSERAQNAFPSIRPSNYRAAQWYSPSAKAWYKGMIVCPNDKGGKRWAFLRLGMVSNFDIVPHDWFHAVSPEDAAKLAPMRELAIKVEQYIQRKQDVRSARRNRTYYLG